MTQATAMILAAVLTAFVALIWRQTTALQSMSGARTRGSDRDRRDLFQFFERLMERNDTRDRMQTTRIHAQERVSQVRSDAGVEQSAQKKPDVIVQENETCTPDEYEV